MKWPMVTNFLTGHSGWRPPVARRCTCRLLLAAWVVLAGILALGLPGPVQAATTRSVELLEGVSRPDLLGEALLRMSMMYRRVSDFDNSVTMAMQAMEIAKRTKDP